MICLGSGAGLAALALDDDRDVTRTGNVAINASAGDPRELSAHNSPTFARNPVREGNLVIANRVDAAPFDCELHVSMDAGATWSRTRVPFAPDAPRECFAPDAAFGSGGRLYFTYVTLAGPGNVPNAAWIATSNDGGRTLSRPRRVAGPLTFQLRVATDPTDPDRVYLTYVDAREVALLRFVGTDNPIRVIRSNDGGVTWNDPGRVNPPRRERVVAPTPLVGADGVLHVLYLDLLRDRLDYHGRHKGRGGRPYQGRWELVLASSRNRGRTWSQSVVEPRLVPGERFIAFIPPFPSLAADSAEGRLYAAFQDAAAGDRDVRLWVSEDGGRTWGEGVRVNDTPDEDGTSQYLPQVEVAPDGRVDLAYYDRRGDPRDVRTEVSLQFSRDGGETFGARTMLSDGPFDARIGFGFERELPDLGSRIALASADDEAVAAWGDSRAGARRFPKQDLAITRVRIDDERDVSPALRVGLIAGAGTVALAGLALLVIWVIARRRLQPDD